MKAIFSTVTWMGFTLLAFTGYVDSMVAAMMQKGLDKLSIDIMAIVRDNGFIWSLILIGLGIIGQIGEWACQRAREGRPLW